MDGAILMYRCGNSPAVILGQVQYVHDSGTAMTHPPKPLVKAFSFERAKRNLQDLSLHETKPTNCLGY